MSDQLADIGAGAQVDDVDRVIGHTERGPVALWRHGDRIQGLCLLGEPAGQVARCGVPDPDARILLPADCDHPSAVVDECHRGCATTKVDAAALGQGLELLASGQVP